MGTGPFWGFFLGGGRVTHIWFPMRAVGVPGGRDHVRIAVWAAGVNFADALATHGPGARSHTNTQNTTVQITTYPYSASNTFYSFFQGSRLFDCVPPSEKFKPQNSFGDISALILARTPPSNPGVSLGFCHPAELNAPSPSHSPVAHHDLTMLDSQLGKKGSVHLPPSKRFRSFFFYHIFSWRLSCYIFSRFLF